MRLLSKRLPAFVGLVLILLSLLAYQSPFGLAQSDTSVSGIISSDTKWTKANSPYNVTGAVIAKGVTVTIEPGTIVYINAFEGLVVNGTLRAIGTSNEPIILNGDYRNRLPVFGSNSYNGILSFSSESQAWDDNTGTGCIIENSNIISLSIYIHNATIKVNNNVFSGSYEYHRLWIEGGNSIITNNRIIANTIGTGDNFPESGNNIVIDINNANTSLTPTISSSPTASAPASSNPTPTVPELSWLVIVPLLLSVFSIALLLRHPKAVRPKQ